jgi:hypothetical protein
MAKKESPKKENKENFLAEAAPKPKGWGGRMFGIIKFVLGVCLLSFVYSTTVSFLGEFSTLDPAAQNNFWAGLITLIVIYLFVWEPAIIYAKGQKIIELIFSFLKPLVRVAPYLLPVYTLVLFLGYLVLSAMTKSPKLLNYFLFLFGLSQGLHLIFGAKSLRGKQEDFLKSNYIFGFSFVYILNLCLTALILNFIFAKFSVVGFLNNSYQAAANIFRTVFGQLFLF